MIFKQWREILEGKKTQTRRLVREGDYVVSSSLTEPATICDIWSEKRRLRFAVGQQLPVIPKRGQKAIRDEQDNIRRVVVLRLRQERLQDISEVDAKAEGVSCVSEYRELWQSINGKTKGAQWDDNPLVWVITFKVALPAAA